MRQKENSHQTISKPEGATISCPVWYLSLSIEGLLL